MYKAHYNKRQHSRVSGCQKRTRSNKVILAHNRAMMVAQGIGGQNIYDPQWIQHIYYKYIAAFWTFIFVCVPILGVSYNEHQNCFFSQYVGVVVI